MIDLIAAWLTGWVAIAALGYLTTYLANNVATNNRYIPIAYPLYCIYSLYIQ